MISTFFKALFGIVIALPCVSISAQEIGAVEGGVGRETPAHIGIVEGGGTGTIAPVQVTRNPESLKVLCAFTD